MYKSLIIIVLVLLSIPVQSQNPPAADIKHPAQYKPEWQRLLLQLSSSYYTVVKDGQVDLDNSLIYTSRSLGLSRLPVIAEGIDDPELAARSQWVDKRNPQAGIKLLEGVKGRQRLELLALLGGYYVFEPFSYQQCKDSALYYLNRAINESRVAHDKTFERLALCLMGKMYVQANDPKGDTIFDGLVKECRDAGDEAMEARAWAYRGSYTGFTLTSIPKRIIYMQKAGELYHRQGNTEGEIIVLTYTCYLNTAAGKITDAHKYAIKALGLEESIHFPYTHYNTDAIAMVDFFNNEFGEPLKYALETIKTAEATRDSIGWAYFYNRLSSLYNTDQNSYGEGMRWSKKALYRFLAVKEASYLNLFDLTSLMLFEGNTNKVIPLINMVYKTTPPVIPSDKLFYYLALESYYADEKVNDLSSAGLYLFKADSVEKEIEKSGFDLRRIILIYKFGQFYFRKGEYAKARSYLKQYLTDPSRSGGLNLKTNSLELLTKIDSLLKDPNAELRDWKRYTRLRDSSFTIAKIKQEQELNVKYATEEKENQIVLLNKDKRLEQANLEQANTIEKVAIAGMTSVLIIAGLLYRQSRLRKKNSELITHKNDVITHKNELLQNLVTEKEWLLKEVHHRVKNNLHTVICLLESQARYLENDALKAVENSQHRIYAMSLIHQKLYQSDDIKTIDMAEYIPELVRSLEEGFGSSDQIQFKLVIDRVNLDISHAIPIGLIINEAVTNSIKYAFPNNRKGEISISLINEGSQVKLKLADNGIGMPHIDIEDEPESLGLRLMKGLSEDIDADISFEVDNGTRIIIVFKPDTLNNPEGILRPSEAREIEK